jgi:hypothetical protein
MLLRRKGYVNTSSASSGPAGVGVVEASAAGAIDKVSAPVRQGC